VSLVGRGTRFGADSSPKAEYNQLQISCTYITILLPGRLVRRVPGFVGETWFSLLQTETHRVSLLIE
jgi:hypothetical protein